MTHSSNSPFCDILNVLVEQGIIGALLFTMAAGIALNNTYAYSKPLFYAILSLIIFSMFSYPFELHPYKIILILIAALSPHKLNILKVSGLKGVSMSAFVYAILTVASIYINKYIKYYTKADSETILFSKTKHPAFLKDYYVYLQMKNDDDQYLFDFAKTLRKEKRYNDSNAILRMGTLISNDPMFYILQGNNYKDMECFEHAERSYLKAHGVMPNRLYPLYQLMILYQDTKREKDMKKIAKKIVATTPKIPSKATTEMINKAKQCL